MIIKDAAILVRSLKDANIQAEAYTIKKGSYTQKELKLESSRISEYIIFTKIHIDIHRESTKVLIGQNLVPVIGLKINKNEYITGFHKLNQPTKNEEDEVDDDDDDIALPHVLYLTCDQVVHSHSTLNGKQSNILAIIPASQDITFQPNTLIHIPLNSYSQHRFLTFKLLDQDMEEITPESIYFTLIITV